MDVALLLSHVTALVSLVGTALVFGTDAFCALVQRPALMRVDDRVLTTAMGNIHRFGDARMPVPGVIGLVFAIATAVSARIAGAAVALVLAALAAATWVLWLLVYARISAPINRTLTAAADADQVPENTRALQQRWDSVIVLRATLLGLALVLIALTLL